MAQDAVIRRGDQQPLGSLEQVKAQIEKAFPGTQFKFVRDDDILSWLNPALPILELHGSRHPCWEATFEGDMLMAVFDLGTGPIVEAVRLLLGKG